MIYMQFSSHRRAFSHKIYRTIIALIGTVLFSLKLSYAQKTERDSLLVLFHKTQANIDYTIKDTVHVNLLSKLCINLRFYKADSMLTIANKALQLSKAINYKEGEILALNHIGSYYSDKGNLEKATQIISNGLKLAQNNKFYNQVLKAHNDLGIVYFRNNDYENALNEYLKGVELGIRLDNKVLLSSINENIAIMYATQGDDDEALKYFTIARKLNEEINDISRLVQTDINIARTYLDMGKLNLAMSSINSNIHYLEENKIMAWLAYAYELKGKIYYQQKKYKWAMQWYNQSMSLHNTSVEDEIMKIPLLIGMAETDFELNNDIVAEKNAVKALEISKKLNDLLSVGKSAELLFKIKKKNNDLKKAIHYHEIFKEISDSLVRNESVNNLLMLKAKFNHEKQKKNLIRENEKALALQKNYIYAALMVLLVMVVIIFLISKNQKIQKELNDELQLKKVDLEKNEIKLKSINETKDKMFSIIGHDLRGPIGAFQGLLQLSKNGQLNQAEFLNFVPKLKTDIDNISFTLNNLLSWGQSQMNGSVTRPRLVVIENLVKNNIDLFSEIASNKSIKFNVQFSKNTQVWTDPDQLNIILRNLISNALKFTPKNGFITIRVNEKNKHCQVSVEDTGIGIKKENLNKLFQKGLNITTYGTEDEKGTGLGLVLCKEMVENNNGKIWVESILNEGTSFYFTLPKTNNILENTN